LPKTIIEKGDHLSFDLGVVYEGYCSGFGRTVSFGEPGQALRKAFDTVYEMQMIAFQLMNASGRAAEEVDAGVREVCRARGYSARVTTLGLPAGPADPRDDERAENGSFYHGLGHSVGLEVHGFPFMQYTEKQPLVPGTVMASEPSLIKSGVFGCRIEDLILITEDGAEWLENHPRGLLVVD
jgi:Xaa-Pro aminopeptidase